MKFRRLGSCAICLTAALTLGLAGCGGGGRQLGEQEKGDRTEITFLCSINTTSQRAWDSLVAAYNDGVGYEEDDVYVTIKNGNGSPSSNFFTQSTDYACNVIAVNDSQNDNGLQALMISRDSRRAPNGYFLDLTEYAAADEDFQQNTISEQAMNWGRMTYNANAAQGAGEEKHVVGEGQNLMAVPYGGNPQFNWYNEALFEAQGINIISVEEEKLDGTGEYAKVQPHGYAEYKEAPFDGAQASQTLDGRTVYKVFNNCIGMNWEEMRNILKYFTKTWNSASTSNYGFVSEYWFNYGWSVGGDVMGFNGEDYDFTLLDQSANYIVTKDGTVINGNTYNAGEIVLYEDKVNQSDIASMDGVYAIESQYNAVKEYVSLQVSTENTVDVSNGTTYKGYEVANPDTGSADNWFNTAQIAMVRGSIGGINDRLQQSKAADFNMCPCETYREYEGGSVYYSGDETFANEYLRVIGESYDDLVTADNPEGIYTGELKVVDGTPIVGNSTTASISEYLVIPACSDPEKYQAAWDFISWVATEGQQYIAYTGTVTPMAQDVLFSDAYAYNSEVNGGKNYYAIAMMAANTGRGDWGYFESGSWVTNWANDFNGYVRRGTMKLTDFLNDHKDSAKQELDNMYCVIEGVR